MSRLISHVRNNAVGYAALFVAVGGTSYAAVALPANSVGSRQLKNHAVTATKVRPHSLGASVFKKGTLLRGPVGAPGGTGPQGVQGPKGDPGNTNVHPFHTTLAAAGTNPGSAATATLGTDGPFSLVGKCYTVGTVVHAESYLRSTVNGLLTDYESAGENATMTAGTDVKVGYDASADTSVVGQRDLEGPYDGTFAITNDDGSIYMTGLNTNGARVGGDGCFFAGYTTSG